MQHSNNDISWSQPHHEYPLIMSGLLVLIMIGLASALFPIVEVIMSIIFVSMIVVGLVLIAHHILRERRLDRDAFYGPIHEEEKENVS